MIDVAVIGAGAWGTALAMRAARNGKATYLRARNPVLRAALAHPRWPLDESAQAHAAFRAKGVAKGVKG